MADYATCLANAQKIDPQAVLCVDWVCKSVPDYIYKFCHCQPPNPPQNPCPYAGNSPVPVYKDSGGICYCCCSCFAWHTPIAVPDGDPKPIQTFVVGDNVLAAGADLKWTPYEVEFSDGIPPGPDYGKTMFSIYYQLPEGVSSLIVTADHVFLLSDGKLRRSEFLIPGKDSLMSADGKPVPVLSIEVGGWFGGVHHIATSGDPATSVEGHLLNSKGIVTGDWALQIADIEGGAVAGGEAETGPVPAATAEFVQAHGLEGDIFRHSAPGAEWEHARHLQFKPYGKADSLVPEEAMHFISRKQAEDVYKNSAQAPVSSIAGQDMANYLFRLFQGFYPDVNFRLEWGEVMPNAFSWFSYDVPFVVINGGLVRTKGVDYNTLALIIGHELGHLYGGAPLSGDGVYSCEGQADYAATIGVLRGVYYVTEYYKVASAGVKGVENFFNYIDPINRKGVPGQTCDGLSTDCRLQAFRAGLNTQNLPECAGGPKITYLTLTAAIATMGEDGLAAIELTFDAPLDAASASHPENYAFDPKSEVLSATPVSSDPGAVTLTSKLDADSPYQVSAQNIMSASGEMLQNNYATIAVAWSKPNA
jgi:hypothetical protein